MSLAIRLARQDEAEEVRAICAAAFIPAYAPIIGTAPRPALEDYAPRIGRGEVWLMDTAAGSIATLVLEPHEDHLLVYSIAVRPEHQGRGYARRLLAFAEEEARRAGHRESGSTPTTGWRRISRSTRAAASWNPAAAPTRRALASPWSISPSRSTERSNRRRNPRDHLDLEIEKPASEFTPTAVQLG
jgi:GNAT superfamily N-acetyltransferase